MEKGKIKLRLAKATDVKSIIDLLGQLGRQLPKDRYKTKFQKLIKSYILFGSTKGSRGIILATTDSKIIGLSSFELLERLNQPLREFWIPELVVSEEHRSHGIGKLLIQKCEFIAKRKKCYRIRLESRDDRIDSHNFYKRIGFQEIALTFEKRVLE
ncbi:MAG TPA: GNAT family N-acetyltransferase [Nitrososphaeraceae archaeon]|jgi:GNAT superfamily N-acetyltransferase|nr:GNAT family N-acetyltransferase [Nitrososphaeraceae archaeon]